MPIVFSMYRSLNDFAAASITSPTPKEYHFRQLHCKHETFLYKNNQSRCQHTLASFPKAQFQLNCRSHLILPFAPYIFLVSDLSFPYTN